MYRINILLSMMFSLTLGSELRGSHQSDMAIPDEDSLGFLDTGMVAEDEEDMEEETMTDGRSLIVQYPVQCEGPVVPFDLKFNVEAQGGYDTSRCTNWRKRRLGNAINSLLLDYGVGQAGQGDDVEFHAEVCTTPTTDRRRLATCNCSFLYRGVMNCGYCGDDNKDRRALEREGDGRFLATGDTNWFVNIYAPSMENALKNAFVNNVEKDHKECLGNGPMVDVQITKRNSVKTSVC